MADYLKKTVIFSFTLALCLFVFENPSGAAGQGSAPDEVSESASSRPDGLGQPLIYTVEKGDSLWRIARRLGVTVRDIKELNFLKTSRIKPGQMLLTGLYEKTPAEEEEISAEEAPYGPEAEEVGPDAPLAPQMPEPVKEALKSRLIAAAKEMLNVPYRFGGNSFVGIDCSAFVKKAFELVGIELPRTARAQFDTGRQVGKDTLGIGDLVFFRTYAHFPSHVGIYIGSNLFIHASSKARKVTIDSLDTPYYMRRFIGAKRLF